MAAAPLLPNAACLALDAITLQAGIIVLKARTVADRVCCPACGTVAHRLHSRYPRTLLDLPWQGYTVRIELICRKLFCQNQACARRIFTEPLPHVAARYAHKTERLADALRELAYLTGGEAASRIARAFGLVVSPDALLEQLHREPLPVRSTPRVLGIDDFAFRKGHYYGTILIDLEQRCPVDLLPDREAASVARWLVSHPGVEIISRDRGSAYIEGASAGAPRALQVADRWHLIKNLGEALEREVLQHYRPLRELTLEMASASEPEANGAKGKEEVEQTEEADGSPRTRVERQSALKREQRLARYTAVWDLRRQGLSARDIACRTGVSHRTVQRFLAAPGFPERSRRSPQPKRTDAFTAYLHSRWAEGCHNARQLFREAQDRGYRGCYTNVYRLVHGFADPGDTAVPSAGSRRRNSRPPARARPAVPSSRSAAAWLQGQGFATDPAVQVWQRSLVERLCQRVPVLQGAGELAQQFLQIVKDRRGSDLEAWLPRAEVGASKEMKLFARGLRQDLSAVRNALTLEWSNGPVEGQVNRLKFIKRSMYGRATFYLLRARVLHQPARSIA